jgi:hypothetical protein
MSGHCEDVCTPDTMVCALVHGSIREVRRGWQSQKSLIFMHFHGVFLGSQHEIWSKQHNGKVRCLLRPSGLAPYGVLRIVLYLTGGVPRAADDGRDYLQSQALLAFRGFRSS